MARRLPRASCRVRNVCVLAHVDHGKTTLTDSLIASNGIIHPKMAGKLRYLDSRDDEQQRGITMKSTAIALLHAPRECQGEGSDERVLVNLVDSPGHVDFCCEVSTAARISDGAVVLVDVCEGVCIQTHAVLRQAWEEGLKCCLVINKIDRLIEEIKLTPMEAYVRIQRVISQVNNIVSGFDSERHFSEAEAVLAHAEASGSLRETQESTEDDSEELAFLPQAGNVAFASALDGWAFRTRDFAKAYAKKMGCSEKQLNKAMWGDYYYLPKLQKITKKKPNTTGARPMFVQFALEPLWQAYSTAMQVEGITSKNPTKEATQCTALLQKMAGSLHLLISDKDLKQGSMRQSLQAFLRAWLPLAPAVMDMVVEHLPSPVEAAPLRVDKIYPSFPLNAGEDPTLAKKKEIRNAIASCSGDNESEVVVYVSKMVAVPTSSLPQKEGENLWPDDASTGESFIAFGRVFCGLLREGQTLYHLPTGKDKGTNRGSAEVTAKALFLMMGRGLERLDSVPAGHVIAIAGLGDTILKSATLSTSLHCEPFLQMKFQTSPILKVAVEPMKAAELPILLRGLRLLNMSDPFVEISVEESGEHVIGTAGEVHLERCLKDLRDSFACVELSVSPPLIMFRESVMGRAEDVQLQHTSKPMSNVWVEQKTPNGLCTIKARALPLPPSLAQILEENASTLRDVFINESNAVDGLDILRSKMSSVLEQEKHARQFIQRAWCLGPQWMGPNILLATSGYTGLGRPTVARMLGFAPSDSQEVPSPTKSSSETPPDGKFEAILESGVTAGFQAIAAAGPLCEEPLWGVAFEVAVEMHEGEDGTEPDLGEEQYGPFSGQVLAASRLACSKAMMAAGPRLVEAMFLCEVATSSEALGGVYAVLGRRRAKVIREEMREGSDFFTIHAYLPVADSVGLATELRRKTSGAASAQLLLSHWERLPVDPFFKPQTEEEREEFGEAGEGIGAPNIAKKMINGVRRRKGLPVEEKVVESATKQRTLARKV